MENHRLPDTPITSNTRPFQNEQGVGLDYMSRVGVSRGTGPTTVMTACFAAVLSFQLVVKQGNELKDLKLQLSKAETETTALREELKETVAFAKAKLEAAQIDLV